jgi:hypothetical protein
VLDSREQSPGKVPRRRVSGKEAIGIKSKGPGHRGIELPHGAAVKEAPGPRSIEALLQSRLAKSEEINGEWIGENNAQGCTAENVAVMTVLFVEPPSACCKRE